MNFNHLLKSLLLICAWAGAAQAARYEVVDVGPYSVQMGIGPAINSQGLVASQSSAGVYIYNGAIQNLSLAGEPGAVNSRGHIAGWANDQAYYYDGTRHNIGMFGGSASYAYDLNDSGIVVGASTIATPPGEQFIYHAYYYDGTMHDLNPQGASESLAYGINASGQVTGYARIGSEFRVFRYDGVMHDLGTMGGTSAMADAINDSGNITGVFSSAGSQNKAFLYDGGVHDLGVLGAGYLSRGFDINNDNTVVGFSYTKPIGSPSNDKRAVVSFNGQPLIDLNTLIDSLSGWKLEQASEINDAGQIVGFGTHNGQARVFLLNPVPEPASIAFAVLSLVVLSALCLRRHYHA